MQMPKPNKNHEKLAAFAGNWSGPETIHPTSWDPAGGQAKGEMKCRVDFDGFGIVQDYVQKRGGKVAYRGHGVMGYDAQAKTYVWHWSDSMGGVPLSGSRGTWKGNKLVFEHAPEDAPEGCARGRYTYTFKKDGTLGFSIENSSDGKSWAKFIEATYTKK